MKKLRRKKIRVGDQVICVDASGTDLIRLGLYKCLAVRRQHIIVNAKSSIGFICDTSRFQLSRKVKKCRLKTQRGDMPS